jgi:hypothetical protein
MNSNFGRFLTAGCFLVWAGYAQANMITNGSFENTGGTFVDDGNKTMSLPSGSAAIPGWTTTNWVRPQIGGLNRTPGAYACQACMSCPAAPVRAPGTSPR